MACRVVYGIVNRKSTADAKRNTTAAQQQLDEAGSYYGNSNWKQHPGLPGVFRALARLPH